MALFCASSFKGIAMAKEQEISKQVYDLVQSLKEKWVPEVFFRGLMTIYGTAERSVDLALAYDKALSVASQETDETMERPDLAIKQRAYFRFLKNDEDVAQAVDAVRALPEVQDKKNKIQFIICCSSKSIDLYDLVENDGLFLSLEDLPDNYTFLTPLKDGRHAAIKSSQEADKRACLKLTKLLETLARHNSIQPEDMQKLNSFMVRMLFCFFAEDTGIFSAKAENMFTNAFDRIVDRNGTNAKIFFSELFTILNTKPEDREQYKHKFPAEIMAFPYVNGGLFKDEGFIPDFDLATRNQFTDCGRLEWHEISPAIFGSMFQGAMKKEDRRSLGAHYTSEENILKIVKPLFLDKLYEEFERLKKEDVALLKVIDSIPTLKYPRKNHVPGYSGFLSQEAIDLDLKRKQRYKDFLARIGRMKFLDPACGCGNFLLVTYKELRLLENEVLNYINAGAFTDSCISISQFYGIEIEDWPAEIAHVSMWLMQHLMNQETNSRFGRNIQSIPLKTSATIVTANALTTDWNDVLPAEQCSCVFGNPAYGGANRLSHQQKEWLKNTYPPKYKVGFVDFVTAWFMKSADFMSRNLKIQTAFVAPNSICQGEQVGTLWGLLLAENFKINFAYTSFPWTNDATDKAGVTCVIVGFSKIDNKNKRLYFYSPKTKQTTVQNCIDISPYLTTSKIPFIIKRISKPISCNLNLTFGNMPNDGGNLLFDYQEGRKFLEKHPEAVPFVKKFIGSSELMKSDFRYCLWLTEDRKDEWSKIPAVMDHVNKCGEWRANQIKTGAAYKFRNIPWRFGQLANPSNPDKALVIPAVTSENRFYVPMDFIDSDTIASNLVFILPNASLYDFGILTSRMHMCWMRLTSGMMRNAGYRYSRDMTFNTFIWPHASEEQKQEITKLAQQIRLIRAGLSADMSLGEMYNPDTMPSELKAAHEALDLAVEKAYRDEPFESDDERLAYLLDLYSDAVAKESAK